MIPKLPFQLNDQARQILGNVSWLSVDRVLRIGIGVIVGAWVARYLGPTQFGLYNFILAYVALCASLTSLGIATVAIRDIVNDPDAKEEILGVSFTLRFLASLLAFSLALLGISQLGLEDPQSFLLVTIIAASIIFNAFDTVDYWFQAQVKARLTVLAKSSAFVAFSIIKVGLILLNAPLIAFAWAGSAELALGGILFIVAYKLDGQDYRRWRWNTARAKLLLRDCWPLLLSGFIIFVYMRIDQIMLAKMVDEKEVGYYSAAVRLAELVAFLPQAVYDSVFPSVVNAKRVSDELFHEKLQKLYNVVVLISYVCLLPVAVLAQWIIVLVYGTSYAPGGPMLAYLALASIFINVSVARTAFTTPMNLTKLHAITLVLGCLANIGLNFLLIPVWGGVGAAVASLIAYWLVAHGSCFLFKPLHRTGFMITKAMILPKV